jgi:D-glycero-D-manno-heptose 1,7-bisphosphate phosphatase
VVNKAFFLDRDGVINFDIGYLHEPDKTELLSGVADAIIALHRAGYLAVVVSNQAGVAKGYYPEADTHAVHARLQTMLLSAGGREALIDAWYFCPHHPKHTGECSCRKPAPGMLLKAAEAFDIDLKHSFMIGDRMSDLEAGVNAGCAASCLVISEAFKDVANSAAAAGFAVSGSLKEAVEQLLNRA